VLLTDDQRRLLGVKGHPLGRTALRELSVRELKQFVYKYICGRAPEETIVMDAMPMTVTGKVDRIRRKQMAESRLGSNASGGRV
jgi:acyl-coenzyme A synthetase/AMP-(fatty) acid ligase